MTLAKGHHLHLIDGSGFIFRAYHALPPLTRKSDKFPIGALSGFSNMLYKMVEEQSGANAPTHLAVIFDHKGKTFRNDIFPNYKANRPPTPEDLVVQFPLMRDATRAFNIAALEVEGFEADDIIATLALRAQKMGARVTIVSSDKDLMQVVGDGITMYDVMRHKTIGVEQVEEKFGVSPARVIDVQSLAGDSVDNIPGAPGIGVKTAALLINEFGDLDTLLARADEIPQPKRRAALLDNIGQIKTSRELVTLKTDMDMGAAFTDFDDFTVKPIDGDVALEFLQRMEFRTLSSRVATKLGMTPPVIGQADTDTDTTPFSSARYETVSDTDTLKNWIKKIYDTGYVAVDTETTGLDDMRAELVGVCLCCTAGQACYIPLAHKDGDKSSDSDLFCEDEPTGALLDGQIPLDEALDLLRPMLEDESILKIGQNIKFDIKILSRYNINPAPIDDTMLLSYALHGGLHNHGMDSLSERYLDHKPISIKQVLVNGRTTITFDKVGIDDATRYAAEDADITLRLWQTLKPRLHAAKVTRVYETLERPLVPVLCQMERLGIKVDKAALAKLSNGFAASIAVLEGKIFEQAGQSFNVGSPKQLGEILFDKLKLEGGKRGKTGAYATGVDVLEDLAAEGASLPGLVLDWRHLSKLKSTYTDALQTHINPDTGRVHTSYVISGASTGRLASNNPNLQNIPIRTEDGRKIRQAFVAEEGNVLLSVDYSQIELRILAHIAKIPALKTAFDNGQDIHAMTASEMFNVPIEGMDPMIRRRAKAINFGVIYGISGFGLARNLRIPRKEAQNFIDAYFEKFPGIRAYMDETVVFAKKHGYVETLFGRRIHTGGINTQGPQAGFAKRAAINAPIQGSAADVIRRAMIRMPEAIADLPIKMLLQVHDELVFEVPVGVLEKATARIKSVMEGVCAPILQLDVELRADAGSGQNWAEAH